MVKRKRGIHNPVEAANALTPADFACKHAPAERLNFVPVATEEEKSAIDDLDRATSKVDLIIDLKYPKEYRSAVDDSQRLVLDDADFAACLALVESTSGDDYRASAMGWNKARKIQEMSDADMRFLLVRTRSTHVQTPDGTHSDDTTQNTRPSSITPRPLLGFLSFMLTHEDGRPVVYIYEIHLRPAVRGTGVGKYLMRLAEAIGASAGMEKSMLTVFRRNERAMAWYARLGYGLDEYSPAEKKLRNGTVKRADYVILSKDLDEAEGAER